jgi:hypothetical protein
MSVEETLARAGEGIRAGQASEHLGTPDAFRVAVANYDTTIGLLRTLPISLEQVRSALAIALMNRGNALQKQHSPDALEAAVKAYDDAIVLLRTLPLRERPAYRNSLGAAWMNRGHAQLAGGEPIHVASSIHSFREAIGVLQTLPLDDSGAFRMNLAAAMMNESNALMRSHEPTRALESARAALGVTSPAEQAEAVLADIGLKARRVACEALGHQLFLASERGESTKQMAEEAIDLVDDGLALARQWEARGQPHFRYISTRLFRFGAQLYAVQHPDFLAEFILEHLDPEISAGAMAGTPEFYRIAAEVLAPARAELLARRTAYLNTPETDRLVQRLQSFRAAEERLAELRAVHLAGPG